LSRGNFVVFWLRFVFSVKREMKVTHVCEGCGEEFISHHAGLCYDCTFICSDAGVVKITTRKPPTVLKQIDGHTKEVREREKRKHSRRKADVFTI